MTKNEMARWVVTALQHRPELVRADHPEVLARARRGTVQSLTRQYEMAVAAIRSAAHADILPQEHHR
jgi:hypothetical protein